MTIVDAVSTAYPCTYPGCTKTFGVRSNAKRHLRTHGTFPQADETNQAGQYTVDLLPPGVSSSTDPVHPAPRQVQPPSTSTKWLPSSLMSCTNALRLREAESSSSEYDGDESDSSCRSVQLSLPLPPVVPSVVNDETDDRFEERNSYLAMPSHPYHPSQVLPSSFKIRRVNLMSFSVSHVARTCCLAFTSTL